MPLAFTVEENGKDKQITSEEVFQYFQDAGLNPTRISPDGLYIYAKDPTTGQELEAPLAAEISDKYGPIKSIAPRNADESGVNSGWRLGVSSLPNDNNVRQTYLQSKLQEAGIADPQILGSGDEWYAFNPKTEKWMSLTNKEGADLSDVAGFAPEVARFAGQTIGGTVGLAVGAPTGPGAIASGAAGSVAGNLAAETLMKGAGALVDPDFRHAIATKEGIASTLKDTALDSLGAGFFGAIPGMGKLAEKGIAQTIGKASMAPGIASRTASGIGTVAEAAGKVGGKALDIADTDLGRGVIASTIPGVGQAQMAGWLAQGPQYLATKGSELLQKGATKIAQKARTISPEFAKGAANVAEEARRWRIPNAGGGASKFERVAKAAVDPEEAANLIKGRAAPAPEATAKDIYGRIGERLGRGADKLRATAAETINAEFQGPMAPKGAKFGQSFGRSFGELADQAAAGGRAVESGIDNALSVGLKAAKIGAKGIEKGGALTRKVAAVTAPIENRALLYGGQRYAEDHGPDTMSSADDLLREWFKQRSMQNAAIYGGN